MKIHKPSIKISWNNRIILFLFLSISWCSGLTFFILNTWVEVEGEFGVEKHPFQYPILKTHGASAFIMMIIFGFLIAAHIPAGLKQKRNKITGIILIIINVFMIITAYLLYYSGEEYRSLVSYAHFIVGLFFPLLLIFHLLNRKKISKNLTPKLRQRD